MGGLPGSFAWGNFTVLAVGVWAIAQRDSVDAVLMVGLGSRDASGTIRQLPFLRAGGREGASPVVVGREVSRGAM